MSRTASRTLVTGMVAGAVSALAMMLCGPADGTTAAAGLNGPGQWVWGRGAARSRRWTLRTVAGFAIHQVSALGWAVVHVHSISRRPGRYSPASLATRAAATAALAATVDYGLTPRRMQPGFDAQLSLGSLLAIYAAFAVGIALCDATVAAADRLSRPPPRPST